MGKNMYTGHNALDKVIKSNQEFSDYLEASEDSTASLFTVAMAEKGEDKRVAAASMIGSWGKRGNIKALIETFTTLMEQHKVFAEIIFETFFNFMNSKNVKMINLSPDSLDISRIPGELLEILMEDFKRLQEQVSKEISKHDDFELPLIFPDKNDKGN